MRGPVSRLLAGAVFLFALALLARALGVWVCTSESLPLGIYVTGETPVEPGTLVLACLPPSLAEHALARGYVGRGRCPGGAAPVGKAVLAVGGGRLFFGSAGVRQGGPDGELVPGSAPRSHDALGRPLPHPPFGLIQLSSDALWLHSPHHPGSFDSRYFGPVPAASVVATLRPLWVAGPTRNFRMRKSALREER